MKYYIEIDDRDIGRFRIDKPCQGSHGNCVLVLKDKYNMTVGFELLTVGFELLPQRPRGEWITKGAVGNGTWCSVCDTNIKLFPNRYGFCPTCGADMRKEGDEK